MTDATPSRAEALKNIQTYFICHCKECDWIGSSEECAGAEPTGGGDFTDALCPECFKRGKEVVPEDADEALACFEISWLRKRLAASEGVRVAAEGVQKRFKEIEYNSNSEDPMIPKVGDGVLYELLEDLDSVLETGRTVDENIALENLNEATERPA